MILIFTIFVIFSNLVCHIYHHGSFLWEFTRGIAHSSLFDDLVILCLLQLCRNGYFVSLGDTEFVLQCRYLSEILVHLIDILLHLSHLLFQFLFFLEYLLIKLCARFLCRFQLFDFCEHLLIIKLSFLKSQKTKLVLLSFLVDLTLCLFTLLVQVFQSFDHWNFCRLNVLGDFYRAFICKELVCANFANKTPGAILRFRVLLRLFATILTICQATEGTVDHFITIFKL